MELKTGGNISLSLDHYEQAREIEQESGTPMRRIMSGGQCGRLCQVEVSLTILKTEDSHRHLTHRSEYRVRPGLKIPVKLRKRNIDVLVGLVRKFA